MQSLRKRHLPLDEDRATNHAREKILVTIAAGQTHQFVLPQAKTRRLNAVTIRSCLRLGGHAQLTMIDGDRPRSDVFNVELPCACGIRELWLVSTACKRVEPSARIHAV